MIRYLLSLWIAIDQLLNTLFGGHPDETLSAPAFRWELQDRRAWPRELIDMLFFWQEAHCYGAWRAEVERSQLPSWYTIEGLT